MFEAYKLPPKSEIKNEIVKFLSTVESASPKEINNHIIKVFDISIPWHTRKTSNNETEEKRKCQRF